MSKSKHTAEWKIEMVKKYLSGEGSYATIAALHSIGERTLKDYSLRGCPRICGMRADDAQRCGLSLDKRKPQRYGKNLRRCQVR